MWHVTKSFRAAMLSSGAMGALLSAMPVAAQENVSTESGAAGEDEAGNVIVVTGSIRDSLENATETKRAALNVTDVATADSVGRFPDENIAAALARLPGVAVQLD